MSSPAQAASADAATSFAPELPLDALRLVLAPYAGNVAQLCAAACVSRAWRAAAAERQLWKSLHIFQHLKHTARAPRPVELTVARLAELVTRGGSGVGGQPHLELLSLEQSKLTSITARGVATALAGAGLEGKLHGLYVAGVLSSEGDDEVIPQLRTFLTSDYARLFSETNAHQHLLCNAPQEGGVGQPPVCSRLCTRVTCTLCEINLCCWCCIGVWNGRDFNGTPVCDHMCAHCGRVRGELLECTTCSDYRHRAFGRVRAQNLCENCVGFCSGCDDARCFRRCFGDMHGCAFCGLIYCDECNQGVEWAWCALCDRSYCTGYGTACTAAADIIKSAADWVPYLEAREGGLDAAVAERLLASVEEDDDETGDLLCHRCVDEFLKPEGAGAT